MRKTESKVLKIYRTILQKYMKRFGLESVDIAFLAKSTKSNINSVLESKTSVGLETMESISSIFNLSYYEFGNPNHPMPSLKSLPDKTKQRIIFRKKEGPHIEQTYNSLSINDKITLVLSKYEVDQLFLTEEIIQEIKAAFPEDPINTTLIGDRLKKSFQAYVQKTEKQAASKIGRGRKPYYYKIIASFPLASILAAKESINTKWSNNY